LTAEVVQNGNGIGDRSKRARLEATQLLAEAAEPMIHRSPATQRLAESRHRLSASVQRYLAGQPRRRCLAVNAATTPEPVFTMLDDLRHGLAAYPRRAAAPECAVCGRPIVDQYDFAFADREHANLHEACATDISSPQ
jgi:hypothetical protein